MEGEGWPGGIDEPLFPHKESKDDCGVGIPGEKLGDGGNSVVYLCNCCLILSISSIPSSMPFPSLEGGIPQP